MSVSDATAEAVGTRAENAPAENVRAEDADPRFRHTENVHDPRAAALRDALGAGVALPGEAAYEALRMPWNLAVAQRPSAVTKPTTAEEVIAIVRAATPNDPPLRHATTAQPRLWLTTSMLCPSGSSTNAP